MNTTQRTLSARELRAPSFALRSALMSVCARAVLLFQHGMPLGSTPLRAAARPFALGRMALPLLAAAFLLLAGCGLKSTEPTTSKTSPYGQKVVSTAYAQMGKRYRAGGDSPQKGFDCSGLIWWAYSRHGISVPRITKDQARAGMAVSSQKPQPGDIIVFRTSQGPQGLHTAIYSGNGTFIHSPRRGERVRMESLETPYWKNKLVTVRRILP